MAKRSGMPTPVGLDFAASNTGLRAELLAIQVADRLSTLVRRSPRASRPPAGRPARRAGPVTRARRITSPVRVTVTSTVRVGPGVRRAGDAGRFPCRETNSHRPGGFVCQPAGTGGRLGGAATGGRICLRVGRPQYPPTQRWGRAGGAARGGGLPRRPRLPILASGRVGPARTISWINCSPWSWSLPGGCGSPSTQ